MSSIINNYINDINDNNDNISLEHKTTDDKSKYMEF